MAVELSFSNEIANIMYASHGEPITNCLQCGTCSGTCPAVEFMDNSPREIIGMIRADLKEEVLASNTYWTCASCYHCTVRCPAEIDIADMMYTLKRYSMWKGQFQEGLTATGLVLKGKMPLLPKKIKGLKKFQQMVRRIIPIGEPS